MEKSASRVWSLNHLRALLPWHPAHRPWDWQAAILTIALVQLSATRLVITEWVPLPYLTQTFIFLGVVLGLALGYSGFKPRTVMRLASAYTFVLVPMQLVSGIEAGDSLLEKLGGLSGRFLTALIQFIQNQPVYDPIFFIAWVTLGYWIIGLFAGYQLERYRNFLKIVLPSGLAMLIVQIYDPWLTIRVWAIALFIFIALILLGRLYFLQSRTNWNEGRVFATPDALQDLRRSAWTVAAITVFVAWSLPVWLSSIGTAAHAWKTFTRPIVERLSDAVSALDSPYGDSGAEGNFYGESLTLGRFSATGDTPVFTINVIQEGVIPVRYYWRGRVYDTYLNGRWSTSSDESRGFTPNKDEVLIPDPANRRESRFSFTLNFPDQELLYTPAEAIWVNRKSTLLVVPASDSALDVTAWLATEGVSSGEGYEVHSLVRNPSVQELRAAGTEYPEWITSHYLQIPDELNPQIRELATEVAGAQATVYDQVTAVTGYLRTEIAYETPLAESPPADTDSTLWFLFEYKKGFCIYYASADVLMLRSLGIPARMAVGFSEGDHEESEGEHGSLQETFTVKRFHSHAWPEVFFPDIGWVEFEPTTSQDPLNRPLHPVASTPVETDLLPRPGREGPSLTNGQPEEGVSGGSNDRANQGTESRLQQILVLATILGLIACGIFIVRRYTLTDRLPVYLSDIYRRTGNRPPRWLDRWTRWVVLNTVERAFHTINMSLAWLGRPQPIHATPTERGEALSLLLPAVQDEIHALVAEHQTMLFTPNGGDPDRALRAGRKILIAAGRLRIHMLSKRFFRRSS